VALAAQGQYNEAIFNFGRAIDIDPDYPDAKQNLAQAQRERSGGSAPAPNPGPNLPPTQPALTPSAP
jgi:tetratricopeptide (TPR) repeat protein